MLTKYYFNQEGGFLGKAIKGSLEFPKNLKPTEIKHNLPAFPWPVVLKEGFIVEDTSVKGFEGKYYPVEEAEAMIAKRDKNVSKEK